MKSGRQCAGRAAIAIAWLLGLHLLQGNIAWLSIDSCAEQGRSVSATSGHVLFPLVVLFSALAWGLRRLNRGADGHMYQLVAVATMVASVALLMWFGFAREGDPHNITWTLAAYALAALAAGVKLDRADATCAGSALLFATLSQAIVFRFSNAWQISQPWVASLLTHSTLIAIACAFPTAAGCKVESVTSPDATQRDRRPDQPTGRTASAAVVGSSYGASGGDVDGRVRSQHVHNVAGVRAWMAGGGVDAALHPGRIPSQFNLSQIALALAILCGVTSIVQTSDWYTTAAHPWLDPRFIELQGIALAIYCVVLVALRWTLDSLANRQSVSVAASPSHWWLSAAAKVVSPPWPTVDRLLEMAPIAVAVLVTAYGADSSAAQELSPTSTVGQRQVPAIDQFEIAGISHLHASDFYAWMFVAAVAILLLFSYWLRRNDWRVIGLSVLAMAMCPLLAVRFESDVAVALAAPVDIGRILRRRLRRTLVHAIVCAARCSAPFVQMLRARTML